MLPKGRQRSTEETPQCKESSLNNAVRKMFQNCLDRPCSLPLPMFLPTLDTLEDNSSFVFKQVQVTSRACRASQDFHNDSLIPYSPATRLAASVRYNRILFYRHYRHLVWHELRQGIHSLRTHAVNPRGTLHLRILHHLSVLDMPHLLRTRSTSRHLHLLVL